MILLPKNRAPTSPGRMLKRFLDDYKLTQTKLAELTDMQLRRVNEILKAKRAVTPDTALRLARFFGTTPDLWLNAQLAWDLWHAARESGPDIEQKVTPLAEAAKAQPARKSASAGKWPSTDRGGGGVSYGSVTEFAQAARTETGVRYSRASSVGRRRAGGLTGPSRSARAGSRSRRTREAARSTRARQSK